MHHSGASHLRGSLHRSGHLFEIELWGRLLSILDQAVQAGLDNLNLIPPFAVPSNRLGQAAAAERSTPDESPVSTFPIPGSAGSKYADGLG
jgi:hypothetical protein